MITKKEKKIIQRLIDALEASIEHHEYCGYGDSWEREARPGLQKQFNKALPAAKQLVNN